MATNAFVTFNYDNYSSVLRIVPRAIHLLDYTWGGADFNGPNAPTSLDGVSVTVNNKPAFVYYISPGQININVPDDTATGEVAIQVTTVPLSKYP